MKRKYGSGPMYDLVVDWDPHRRGPMRVRGPAWKIVGSGHYIKVADNLTLSSPRQSGHEIEGRVSIGGKKYSAFTSGGPNPLGGNGCIIVRM